MTRISTVDSCLHSSLNPTVLVSKITSSTTISASSRAIVMSRPGEGVSRRHTTAPLMTASAFRCSPAPRNSLKTTTAISWQKLHGVTPLPLALDGRSYEGHWESEHVQFSSYSPSKPAPTNGELTRQHYQAHLRGMERMSSAARAHCQNIEDNL